MPPNINFIWLLLLCITKEGFCQICAKIDIRTSDYSFKDYMLVWLKPSHSILSTNIVICMQRSNKWGSLQTSNFCARAHVRRFPPFPKILPAFLFIYPLLAIPHSVIHSPCRYTFLSSKYTITILFSHLGFLISGSLLSRQASVD